MENMDKELIAVPKCLKKFQPKMSAQGQKFKIFEKKLSLGVRSPWSSQIDQFLRK